MKDKIAKWYKQGLWTEQMVLNAFSKSVLSQEEMNEILEKKEEITHEYNWKN